MFRIFIISLLVLNLFGCANVQLADPKLDEEAKKFIAKPGVAGLYIYRNESFGGAVSMDVFVDNKLLGQSGAQTYFYTEVEPGKHKIRSEAENSHAIEIETIAGKLYFIWQEVKLGLLYAQSKLKLVDETKGKEGVLESKLIKTKQ